MDGTMYLLLIENMPELKIVQLMMYELGPKSGYKSLDNYDLSQCVSKRLCVEPYTGKRTKADAEGVLAGMAMIAGDALQFSGHDAVLKLKE